jgi:hypothetical protein
MAFGQDGAPPEGQPGPGGVSQTVADVNSGLMKIMDAVQAKFPEDAEKLAQVIQAYQGFVDGLGQGPGAATQEALPATTTPEAGAAKVQPAM